MQEPARILFLDDRAENVNAARDMGMQAVHTFGPQAVRAACADVLGYRLPAPDAL